MTVKCTNSKNLTLQIEYDGNINVTKVMHTCVVQGDISSTTTCVFYVLSNFEVPTSWFRNDRNGVDIFRMDYEKNIKIIK